MSISIVNKQIKMMYRSLWNWLFWQISFTSSRCTSVWQLKCSLMGAGSSCMMGLTHSEAPWYNFCCSGTLPEIRVGSASIAYGTSAKKWTSWDRGCPAEAREGGRTPSVPTQSPTELWLMGHMGILKAPRVRQQWQTESVALKGV